MGDGMAKAEDLTPIALPHGTQHRLEELTQRRQLVAQQLQAIDGTIRAVLDTVTEALGVPDGWALRDPAVGFEPPPTRDE